MESGGWGTPAQLGLLVSVFGNWLGDGTGWLKGLRGGETVGVREKGAASASWRTQTGWGKLWEIVTTWKRGRSLKSF